MLLTRKSSERGLGLVSSLVVEPGARRAARDPDDGPARLPAPLGPRRRRRPRDLAADPGAEGRRPPTRRAAGAAKTVVRRTVCSHCSVGCSVDAVVENGVWVRQEPVFDSPHQPGRALRQGRLGARARPRRVPPAYPMKLVDGKYQRISWDQALNEIGDKLLELQEAERTRFDVHRSARQAQQRAVLPAAQVGLPVGQQQLRPPGAHLPLDHGRRRGPDLRLRRDDELVQRPAQLARP